MYLVNVELFDVPPSSLIDSKVSLKWKTTEEQGVGARSLTCNTLGVKGRAGAPRWD